MSKQTLGRTGQALNWSSRVLRRSRLLGGILFVALLHNHVSAVQNITLAWDPSPDPSVVGYNVYFGGASGNYTNLQNAGNNLTATISNRVEGATYYFVARARNSLGVESVPSNEIGYQVPITTLPAVALTAPVNGASYTVPASVNLAGSVTANGHTITKVQFYSGATLLGEDTSSPYSFTWGSVSAGSYSLTARAIYDAGNAVDSSPININVTGLPAPWQTVDIGSVGVAGSANVSNGVYIVKGGGNLSGRGDNFRFVYQVLSGDGEIKVQLNSVENTGPSGRIGVIVREDLTSGSKYAFMGILSDGTFRWQRRSNTGGSTANTTSTSAAPPNVWVRLVRTGNTLAGYQSSDGTAWTLLASRSITMATSIYFGLAVASGNSNTLNTSTLTVVTVVP